MKYLSTPKDRRKFIRSIIQAIVLLTVFWILINTIMNFKEYVHFDKNNVNITEKDKGFIALSYIAVDREGTSTMISKQRLDEHFAALDMNGYTTIKQKDIEDYYKRNKHLPEKSMFLMFEDGRMDTAIFAGDMLEKYNFIGTMLSYGDRFGQKDIKFLMPKDLKKLEKSTFWELGINGYRLSFINVYDRYNNFLGELTYLEYATLSKYFGRNYNHYLMDFIRDEDKIPKETYEEMKKRISGDYLLMDEVYKKELSKLPGAYVLMHSNTGAFGSNEKVSKVNEEWINKLFIMNFNREGYSKNNKESSIYDLTRMQPQAYWYPNHLLMRIADDTGDKIKFVYGDLEKKKDWDIVKGVPEYRESTIALTSTPKGKGLIRLKQSKKYKDYKLATTMTGNKLGSQSIYLRADENLDKYVAVRIKNNFLYVDENGKTIYKLNLDRHDGVTPISVEEDEFVVLNEELKTYKKNTKSYKNPTKMEPQKEIDDKKVRTVAQGADEYIPPIDIHEKGERNLEIYLEGNEISINIDNKEAVSKLPLSENSAGYVYLESSWGEDGYSQRNIADDVYDGVFEDLIVTEISKGENVIYRNKLEGFEKIKHKASLRWNKVLNWFIRTL